MMGVDDGCDVAQGPDLPEDVAAHDAVPLHDGVLLAAQHPGLVQDMVWNPDLADVVQHPGDMQALQLLAPDAHGPSQTTGVLGHPFGMAPRVEILDLHRLGKGSDHILVQDLQT